MYEKLDKMAAAEVAQKPAVAAAAAAAAAEVVVGKV
jgi:hypothetical protein